MKCKLANRDIRIDDFLMGKLATKEAEEFEIHVFGCPECLEELRIREQTIDLIKEERVTAVSENAAQKTVAKQANRKSSLAYFFQEWQQRWVFVGAAAFVLAVIFLGRFLLKDEAPKMMAAHFQENPRLENLMKQRTRMAGFSIIVTSPELNQSFKTEILFRWEIKKNGRELRGPFELKIMDNREIVVYQANVQGRDLTLQEALQPGLYYWTLEDRGTQLYLGKFFVIVP